jgi:protein-tyrosine-phosphatase
MNVRGNRNDWTIWGMALGYFACYVPYSMLTKALSKGLLPGSKGSVVGFELLPATTISTSLMFVSYIILFRGWRHFGQTSIRGFKVRLPRWQTIVSGCATATIIATTTLNYTFDGVSILLALLLMRGGVLMLAPTIDRIFGRSVQWFSWAALGLSALAVSIALVNVDGYSLSTMAVLNLSAYLIGYYFRLHFMTSIAKAHAPATNRRYFLEETLVAGVALTLVPLMFAVFGQGQIAQQLRTGFTTFLAGPMVLPALFIGFCYACLYYFMSWMYLDQRENTFCVPLNRCSSLMSGIVASYAMMFLLGTPKPNGHQLLAAAVIIVAFVVLGVPALSTRRRTARPAVPGIAQQVFLFICSGNTSRSPLAAAICTAEIASRLGLRLEQLEEAGVRIASAGITASAGTPMPEHARQALAGLGIPDPGHASRNATEAMVREADVIYCMTGSQREQLLRLFPHVEAKTHCLDPDGDVGDPHGGGPSAYRQLAERMQLLIRGRITELAAA